MLQCLGPAGRIAVPVCLLVAAAACSDQLPTGARSAPARAVGTASAPADLVTAGDEWARVAREEIEGFAGYYRDADGSLTLQLADTGRGAEKVAKLQAKLTSAVGNGRHPRVKRVHKVDYDFAQLQAWRVVIREGLQNVDAVAFIDVDEVRNRVVLGVRPGRDRGGLRREIGDLGVPQRAVEFVTRKRDTDRPFTCGPEDGACDPAFAPAEPPAMPPEISTPDTLVAPPDIVGPPPSELDSLPAAEDGDPWQPIVTGGAAGDFPTGSAWAGSAGTINTLRTSQYTLVAGLEIGYWYAGRNLGTCTLGPNVLLNGSRAHLTSSHCSATPGAIPDGTGYTQNVTGPAIGVKLADPAYWEDAKSLRCSRGYKCRWSDALAIGYFGTRNFGWNKMAEPRNWNTVTQDPIAINNLTGLMLVDPVRTYFYGLYPGTDVHKVGATTGLTSGRVSQTCYDSFRSFGRVLMCQYLASRKWSYIPFARPGDSGAPVFTDWGYGTRTYAIEGLISGGSDYDVVFSSWSLVRYELTNGNRGTLTLP